MRLFFFTPTRSPERSVLRIEGTDRREGEDITSDEPLDLFTVVIEEEECVLSFDKKVPIILLDANICECDIREDDISGGVLLYVHDGEGLLSVTWPYGDQFSCNPTHILDRIETCDDRREYFFARIGPQWDERSTTLTVPVPISLYIVRALELGSCECERCEVGAHEETISSADRVRSDREDACECTALVCEYGSGLITGEYPRSYRYLSTTIRDEVTTPTPDSWLPEVLITTIGKDGTP